MFVLLVPPDWLPAKISDAGIIDEKRIERAIEFVTRKFSAVKYGTEKSTHESPVRHHTYSFCLVCLKKIESVICTRTKFIERLFIRISISCFMPSLKNLVGDLQYLRLIPMSTVEKRRHFNLNKQVARLDE